MGFSPCQSRIRNKYEFFHQTVLGRTQATLDLLRKSAGGSITRKVPRPARREFPPRPPRASMLDAEKYGGQEANSRCAGTFPSGDGGLVSRRLRAAHRAPAAWLAGHRERRKCPDSRPDRQWQDSNCVSLVSGPA